MLKFMPANKVRMLAALAAVLLLAVSASTAAACPTCAKALSDGQGGDPVAGYFWSILFMLSMPPLIFSGLCTMFYLQVRKARRLAAAQETAQTATAPSTLQERELVEV